MACTLAYALLKAHCCAAAYLAVRSRPGWELSKGQSWKHTTHVRSTKACCGSCAGLFLILGEQCAVILLLALQLVTPADMHAFGWRISTQHEVRC